MVKVMVRAPRKDWPREPSPEKVLRLFGAEIVAARQGHRTVCGKTAARGTDLPAAAFCSAIRGTSP